ncbi:MAG: DUF84 family protein [Bacilli bacterium]|nr:DUF84 family protein [Bacilli bacterium]
MNRVYLGSKNAAKLKAVEMALPDYEIIGIDAKSGVSNQPLTDEETIKGAFNRAKELPQDGLRLGLEAGVEIHNDVMFLINWGVLIDEENNTFYAGGTRIPLPEEVRRGIIEDKKELSEVMEKYSDIDNIRSKEGAIGYLTCNQVTRSDIFIHIVKLLYGQYLYQKKG